MPDVDATMMSGASAMGAFGTVVNDVGAVLLVHRRDVDLWEAPGGRVEHGEAPWDAVVREVAEETGLVVEVTGLVGLYWRPRRAVLVAQFACRVVGGSAQPSDESDDVRYFELTALPERLSPVVRERLVEFGTGWRRDAGGARRSRRRRVPPRDRLRDVIRS